MCLFLSLFGSLLRGKNKSAAGKPVGTSVTFLYTAFRSCSRSATRSWAAFSYHQFCQICWVITPPLFSPLLPIPHIPRRMFHFIEGGISIVWGTRRQRYDLIGCKSTIKGQVSHSLSHCPLAIWHSKQLCIINCRKQFRKLEEKEKA